MASPHSLTALETPSLDEENHNAQLVIVPTIFVVLSFTALVLRIASRQLKRLRLDYDDYLVIASWVVTACESIMISIATGYAGLGYHASHLTESQVLGLKKYIVPILQTTALSLGKASIMKLLHRVFATPRFRRTMIILGTIVLLWYMATVICFIFVCSPIHKAWDTDIPGRCVNEALLNLIVPIPWIVTDFAILIAPIPMVKNLQIPRKEKIGLGALFFTGGFTCIIASYRYSTFFYSTKDISYDLTDIAVWSVIETNVTVICACVLAIKPALTYIFHANIISTSRSSWQRLISSRATKTSLTKSDSRSLGKESIELLEHGVVDGSVAGLPAAESGSLHEHGKDEVCFEEIEDGRSRKLGKHRA